MNYLKSIIAASLLATATLLAACTSIPLTSLPKLASMDMETLDPASIEVAVRLQEGLALPEEGVNLSLSFSNENTGDTLGGDFPLVPTDAPLTPFLAKKATQGRSVLRFRLSEAQAEEVREVRRQALEQKDSCGGKCSLSFAVNTKPCLEDDANPLKFLTFSVYLKTDQQDDFFTFVNNKSIRVDEEMLEAAKGFQRCDAESGAEISE